MSLINQFYNNSDPIVGELVLVEFTNKTEYNFNCILLEYEYTGIMSYQDATKKRKVYSWNKIVPLNKSMVARVDDIDIKSKIVQISIAYLDEEINNKNINNDEIQNMLMKYFIENRMFENFIKSLCIVNNFNLLDIWTKYIYIIDIERQKNDKKTSLWIFFNNNINNINNIINNNDLTCKITELYLKKFNEIEQNIYISKIGIISLDGLSNVKTFFNDYFKDCKYIYTFKYETAPYYLFQTFNITFNEHNNIIHDIKNKISKFNSNIFIKIE